MSDELSREHFLEVLINDVARSPLIERQFTERCAGIDSIKSHDAALRADRDTWKVRAEAQPDAVQGLLDALTKIRDSQTFSPTRDARDALKAFEEAKAKGGK